MARTSISLSDDDLIPGVDKAIKDLERAIVLVNKLSEYKSFGLDFKTPPAIIKKNLQEINKELKNTLDSAPRTYSQLGRSIDRMNAEIRTKMAQARSEVAKTSQAVKKASAEGAQAVTGLGNAAKVAASAAAAGKAVPNAKVTQAAKAVDKASETIQREADATARVARETSVKLREQLRTGPARNGPSPSGMPGLGNLTGAQAGYAAILMQDQKMLKPLHDLKAAAKQLGIKKKELELLLRSQNTAVYKAINEHTNGLIGASNQVRGSVGPGSVGAGGKPPTRRFGGVGHSIARGVSAAGGSLFLTYGSSIPAIASTYAASMAVKKSVSNFAELDQQLRHSRAVSEDYSVSINRMMESVLRTSKRFAAGQKEVAEALQALTQAGVGSSQALSVVNDVMALAAAGDMDPRQAAVTLAGTTQAFGLSFSEATRVADVFAKAAAVSSASVESITEAMKRASSVVRGYGVEVEDVGAAMAVLGKLNITGSPAGTAYMNLIQDLAAPNSNKHKRAQKTLGVKFYDDKTGSPRDLMREIIPEMRNELSKYDKETQATLLRQSVNTRSFRLLKALLDSSQKDIEAILVEMQKSQGYTMEVAYAKNDNLMGDWKKLIAGFNAALTEAGSKNNSAMRQQIQEASSLLNSSGVREGIETLTGALVELGGLSAKVMLSLAAVTGKTMSAVASAFREGTNALDDFFLGAKRMEHVRFSENLQKQAQDSGRALAELAKLAKQAADESERAYQAKVKGETYNANIGVAENSVKEAREAYEKVKADRDSKFRLLQEKEAQMPAAMQQSRGWAMGGLFDSPAQKLSKEIKDLRAAVNSADAPQGTIATTLKEWEKREKGLQELRDHYKRKDEYDRKTTELEVSRRGRGLPQLSGDLAVEDAFRAAGYTKQGKEVKNTYTFRIGGQGGGQGGAQIGRYLSPYDGNFRMTSPLGQVRAKEGGGTYVHKGVDIAMPVGTPLKAMLDGKVLKAHYEGAAGNMVKVQHVDGTIAKYFHMQGFAQGIKAGQTVRAGQLLGTSGNTGRSSGPHLHMETWRNGKPYDFRTWIGKEAGARSTAVGTIVSADNADSLLGKVNDHYKHLQKGLEVNLEKAKLRLDAMFNAGDILTREDYTIRLSKLQSDTERSIGELELQRANTLKALSEMPDISEDGRRSIMQDMVEAAHNAEKRGLSANAILQESEPWRKRLDSIREAIQGYDELAIGIRRSLEAAREEDEFSLRVGRMDEQDAAVATAKREATARYREELERIKAVIEYLESKGADRTPEGQKVISAWTDKAKQLESDMGQAGDKAGELEFQKLMQRRGKDMSRSFTAALTGGNAKEDIRNWIIEEVLAKPFKMKIEMLMQPLMELIAGQLFGMNNGKGGGLGGGGLLGNLINAGVGALLGAFAPKAPAPTGAGLTGSFTPAPKMGGYYSMPRFANGGIMTQDGPLPLRMYSNGGVANSPQLALYGEGSRPEAYVPLPDGRSIPVTMRGGNAAQMSSSVNITINNHSDGSSDSKSEGMGSGGQMDWSRQLAALVQQEMVKQMRPGGLYSQATEQ